MPANSAAPRPAVKQLKLNGFCWLLEAGWRAFGQDLSQTPAGWRKVPGGTRPRLPTQPKTLASRYNGSMEAEADIATLPATPAVVEKVPERVPPWDGAKWYLNKWRTEEEVVALKAKQSQSAKETNAKRAAKGTEEEVLRQGRYRDAVGWVVEHIEAETCPNKANAMAKALWATAKEDKASFLKTYLPLLMRGEKPEEPEAEDEAVQGNIALIDEWFKAREGLCPHCGRSGPFTQSTTAKT